jgi:predicted RNA-binding protein YlqC (UPF0109 family)
MSSIDLQFVEYIVKSLVANPDAVKIERRIDEKGVLLELTVDPEDLGRVIGKRGATANSLRTLLRALGTKNDARYNLKIVDNGTGPKPRQFDQVAPEAPVDVPEVQPEEPAAALASDEPVEPDEPEVPALDEPEEAEEPVQTSSNVISNTRKELEELDDLDV